LFVDSARSLSVRSEVAATTELGAEGFGVVSLEPQAMHEKLVNTIPKPRTLNRDIAFSFKI
jgi:hypothetical protein